MLQKINGIQKKFLKGVGLAFILVGLVLIIIPTGCNSEPKITSVDDVPRITAAQLLKEIEAGSNIAIIDTRTKGEYDELHIAGAILISYPDIKIKASELKGYDAIVLYCTWPAEETSARAALDLYNAGLKNVKAIKGGLSAWMSVDYPLEGTQAP